MNGVTRYPDGWRAMKFGEVVSLVSGSGLPSPDESRFFIGLEHFESDSYAIKRWGSEVDIAVPKTPVRKGDVLFARRNPHLRRCAIAPFDTYFSPDGYAMRSKSEELLQDFLLYVVASNRFMDFAIQHSAGSLSKRVKWQDLARYEFALPPVDEQRRIAEILAATDLIIAKRRETLEAARSLRGAVIENDIWDRSKKEWAWPLIPLRSLISEPVKNGVSPLESEHGVGVETVSIS